MISGRHATIMSVSYDTKWGFASPFFAFVSPGEGWSWTLGELPFTGNGEFMISDGANISTHHDLLMGWVVGGR